MMIEKLKMYSYDIEVISGNFRTVVNLGIMENVNVQTAAMDLAMSIDIPYQFDTHQMDVNILNKKELKGS
jgi:hypothetical protein